MSISAPPRPPSPVQAAPDSKPLEREEIEALVQALIEEARRETRRRHRRYWAVATLVAVVGAGVLILLERGAASHTTSPGSGTPQPSASRPKAALPEELSFDANGSVVLLRRDGRRLPFLSGILQSPGERQRHLYGSLDWSPD